MVVCTRHEEKINVQEKKRKEDINRLHRSEIHHSGQMATNTPSAAHPSPAKFLHSLTYRISESTLLSTTRFKGVDRFPGASSALDAANRYRWFWTTYMALRICFSNSSTSLSKLSMPPNSGIGNEASFHRAVPARFRIFPTAVI